MLRSLKSFLEDLVASPPEDRGGHSLQLAAVALLLEIARADDEHSAAERAAVVSAAQQVFELDAGEVEALLEGAESAVDESVSLYDFTTVINAHCDRPARAALVEQLWRVAYADGRIDRYEEYYLRKIADLLHVSHSSYIRAKLKAAVAAS